MNSTEGLRYRRKTSEPERADGSLHDDVELVEADILTDDQITEYYTTFALRLEASIRRQFHQLNEEDVAELVMDSFVRLVDANQREAIRLTTPEGVYALLKKIAYNRALDILRRRKIVTFEHAPDDAVQDEWIDSANAVGERTRSLTPEEEVQGMETIKQIRDALRTPGLLNDGQRAILQGRYWEGKTHEEMAQELGIPLGTSLSREYYALRKIREHFHKPGDMKRTNRGVKGGEHPRARTVGLPAERHRDTPVNTPQGQYPEVG